ncbi:hypothetical protein OH77DRAFT_1410638 [Trametes cingulata]|nr:hypothetical protein OH77DRAFT_1410638 [Trametes cingulata]
MTERPALRVAPLPTYSNWSERESTIVEQHKDELDLKALVWIHSSLVDDDTLDSLIPFIPELTPDKASLLAYTDLARNVHLPASTLVSLIRSRACSDLLRAAGERLPERTRARSVQMLLKLLEYVPRDLDPTRLGALDVLWTLWELCMGACDADEQDPEFYQTILNGVAALLNEGEPFRLRRAALNLLWESTYQWTYLYCPPAVSNIIGFARASYQHRLSDMFLRASAVAILLAPGLDWLDDTTAPHHRQELRALLRDLTRFLQRANEDGTRCEPRCMGRIAYGLALLAQKDVAVGDAELPAALLESVELGLLDMASEEETAMRQLERAWARQDANGIPKAGGTSEPHG